MLRVWMTVLLAAAVGRAGAQGGDARVTAAVSEMQTLASAEQLCVLDTTYYVSLETLNDIAGPSTPETPYDSLNNEGGTWVIRPVNAVFNSARVNLLAAFNAWQGPYANFQAGRTQTAAAPYDQGSPLDPWGNPYFFYTPAGLVRGDEGAITLEDYRDAFDRPTIVSYGPDGVMSADDLAYQFDGGATLFAVTSVRLAGKGVTEKGKAARGAGAGNKAMPVGTVLSGGEFSVPEGSAIIVRGLNFGPAQGSAAVMWGTTPLTGITSWSDREVAVKMPRGLTGTQTLTVVRGSASRGATLTITEVPNGVMGWEGYR